MVQHCLSHHSCSDNTRVSPVLPTRALYIGDGLDNVHLVEGGGKRARYICLSHCWGGVQPLKTTLSNVHHHLKSIPWAAIPRLFQDALLVTERLGVSYVWIDSLCIIQDDVADWVRESKTMSDVYENAHVTISAASAQDSRSAMIEPSRNNPRAQIMEGINATGSSYSYKLFPTPPAPSGMHLGPKSTAEDLRTGFPLFGRAWAFQERMLSPRVLHFTREELVFECKKNTVCECGQVEHMGRNLGYYNTLLTGSPEELQVLWHETVSSYSRLSLSFGTDKLPALSGLAQRFSRRQPEARYLAGAWDTSLLPDLLWWNEPDDPIPLAHKGHSEAITIAPSWSWAASNTVVKFATRSTHRWVTPYGAKKSFYYPRKYVEIRSADCHLATADPTGQVTGGQLIVSGRLFQAKMWKHPANTFATVAVEPSGLTAGGPNVPWLPPRFYHDVPRPRWASASSFSREEDLFCLPLARAGCLLVESNGRVMGRDETEFAVILESCSQVIIKGSGNWKEPREGDCYRRIGMVLVGTGVPRHDVEDYWSKNPSPFEFGGEEKTITII